MAHKKDNFRSGVTLIELMITVLAVMIVAVGISGILASGHRNYNTMFNRINSPVVRNAYEARLIFDRIVRKSVIEHADLDLVNYDDIYVYYFSDPANMSINAYPDKYAWFYQSGDELRLETGNLTPGTLTPSSSDGVQNIAANVSSVRFTIRGASVRMALVLDNENIPGNTNRLETMNMTVTTTAIRHNKLPDL